ncbi:TonB-dependent receptor plug domain-containing protein [Agaribacterium sp. ZY112]|uniref:TonB-dependent receptor plug domain-containing protein n=1 Tax=Agaribacterium sp. ZY112 TaxID=3233574 RepID=UPI00352347CD
MPSLLSRLGCLLLACCVTTSSVAAIYKQDELLEMSLQQLLGLQVVTAASGYEQKVDEAPATVTLVERRQWQQSGLNTLEDAIRPIAGVHVSKNNITQGNTLISIRGVSGFLGRNVKVLLDGLAVDDAQLGGRSGHLSPGIGNASRIEVVKGPGSVVYGADAYAGVINVALPEAGDTENNQVIARVGDEDHRDLITAYGGQLDQHKWFVAMEYSEAGPDSGRQVDADLQTSFDRIFSTDASSTPALLSEEHKKYDVLARYEFDPVKLDFFYIHAEGTAGSGAANALDKRGWLENTNQYSRIRLNVDTFIDLPGSTELSFIHSHRDLKNRWDVFPQEALLPVGEDGNLFTAGGGLVYFPDAVRGTPSTSTDEYTVKLTHLINLAEHTLRTQLGYDDETQTAKEEKNFGPGVLDSIQYPEDGSPYVAEQMIDVSGTEYLFVPEKISRHYYWFSLQDDWRINDYASASLGLRYDEYSDFGGSTNPRLGLQLTPYSKLKMNMTYGSAFRAPKQGEREIRNNPSLIGNTDLQPETIDTLEFALAYQATSNLLVEANVYAFEASDLIVEVPLEETPSIRQYENSGTNHGRGAELGLSWKAINTLTLKLNASYNTVELDNGDPKPFIPKNMYFAGINWQFNTALNTDVGFKHVGQRAREASDSRSSLKAYNWVTAAITWQLAPAVELRLSAENISDTDAREPSLVSSAIIDDLPNHGRQYLLGFSFSY